MAKTMKMTVITQCSICGLICNDKTDQDIIGHVIDSHESQFSEWFTNKFIQIVVKNDYDNNDETYAKELGKKLVSELDKAFDNDAGNDTTNSIHNNMDGIKSEEDQ